MILNNFYKWLAQAPAFSFTADIGSSDESCKTTTSEFKNINGSDLTIIKGVYRYSFEGAQNASECLKGNGDIANIAHVFPSVLQESDFNANDYSVTPLSGVTQTGLNITRGSVANGYQAIVTATFSNTNLASVTIKSALITRKSNYTNTGSDYTMRYDELLIAEEELSTPLVVPPNTGFTLTVVLNLVRQ